MKKLKAVLGYKSLFCVKPFIVFYTLLSLFIILNLITHNTIFYGEKNDLTSVELYSVFFAGIIALGYCPEDFKNLLQNGFTRKYIFISTVIMILCVSAIIAFINTIIGLILSAILPDYHTLFTLFGLKNQHFVNFLLLFLSYTLMSCIFHFFIVLYHRIGKTLFIVFITTLCMILLFAVPILFAYIIPTSIAKGILTPISWIIKFAEHGILNIILLYITASIILGGLTYLILRRTELKT